MTVDHVYVSFLPLTPSPPHRPENTHKGAAAAQQADLNLLYWSSEGGRMWESGRVCESVEVVWEGVRGVGKYLWLLPRPLQRRWWRRWRCVENVRWYLRRTLMETRMIGSLVLPIGSISLRYIPAILCTLDNLHPSILLSNPPLLTLMVVYPHTSMVHSPFSLAGDLQPSSSTRRVEERSDPREKLCLVLSEPHSERNIQNELRRKGR